MGKNLSLFHQEQSDNLMKEQVVKCTATEKFSFSKHICILHLLSVF